jgi:hypothetical protein
MINLSASIVGMENVAYFDLPAAANSGTFAPMRR